MAGVNPMGAIAVDGAGVIAMGAHETFEPPAGIKKIVVGSDQGNGETMRTEQKGEVLGMGAVVIGQTDFKTAIDEPAKTR